MTADRWEEEARRVLGTWELEHAALRQLAPKVLRQFEEDIANTLRVAHETERNRALSALPKCDHCENPSTRINTALCGCGWNYACDTHSEDATKWSEEKMDQQYPDAFYDTAWADYVRGNIP